MNRVKPPYKFKSPYWTHDEIGKAGEKYRFEIVDFSKCPIKVKKYGNSELNYYKACTLDLPTYLNIVLNKLSMENYAIFQEDFERKLIYGN